MSNSLWMNFPSFPCYGQKSSKEMFYTLRIFEPLGWHRGPLVVSETLFKSVVFDEALFPGCKHLLNGGHYI